MNDARAGDTDAFWRLVYKLQADPDTGQGPSRFDDDLLDFPGISALGPAGPDDLAQAALSFIAKAYDHAEDWLGGAGYDKRGWAGYLALAMLERQGQLDEVPEDAWASWVGALVWYPSLHDGPEQRARKQTLLLRAVVHAPVALANAVSVYVRGQLELGGPAWEVALAEPGWARQLADTWLNLLQQTAEAITRLPEHLFAEHPGVPDSAETTTESTTGPAASDDGQDACPGTGARTSERITVPCTPEAAQIALQVWEMMLGAFLRSGDERAPVLAQGWLQKGIEEDSSWPLAARAATALLAYDDRAYWTIVHSVVQQDEGLGIQVASACAVSRDDRAFLTGVDEQQLAEAYRWLASLFPPESDVFRQGAFFVQPDEQIREWRDNLIKQLAACGTTQAVATLTSLRSEYPQRLILLSGLMSARTAVSASAWSALKPEEVAELFADPGRRLVRSEAELGDLLLEVLSEVEEDLPHHGELLWDRLPRRLLPDAWGLKEAWRPKPEAALQAYVAHELTLRLVGRGLVVNREVLVKPTNAYGAGDRTDILVQATMRHDRSQGPTPAALTVVIEIKCPWNDGLMTDQRQQLAERYLPMVDSATGIYLVGWYPLDHWTDKGDDRLSKVRKLDREQLISDLQTQAKSLRSDPPADTTPILVRIPRPQSQID